MLSRHYETSGLVAATAAQAFDHLDDHTRLSSHMSKPSWKTGGGSMQIEIDQRAGRSVGSRIRLAGRVFGVLLSVEEVVTERDPPFRKTWETIGAPKLLVISNYRLGFTVAAASSGSTVRVFIDYELPERGLERVLGLMFGTSYAQWCVRQMIRDVTAHFDAAPMNDGAHADRRSAT